MDNLLTISDFIINGFVLAIIPLFLAYWLLPTQRQDVRKLITISSVYLIIGSLIFLALSIRQILSYSEGNNEWEKYALTNRLFGSYWFSYWGAALFKGIIPQILWINKARRNIWISIAVVPFLLVDFYMPLIHSNRRDYLPSLWTTYFDFTGFFLNILIFGIILIITFILIRKKNVS